MDLFETGERGEIKPQYEQVSIRLAQSGRCLWLAHSM